MRKIFIVMFLGLSFHPAYSQLKLGIKASPQYTWTSTDSKSITTADSRINISYGLVLDYFFSENYSIGTELSVGTFGGSIKPDSIYVGHTKTSLNDMKLDYKLQYINVPLIIKMRTKEIGYMRYYAEFGLGLSYNFKAKADISSSSAKMDYTNVDANNPDPKDNLNLGYSQKVNFFRTSLIMGAGIQYNAFGNTMIVAGFRYDNALNDFTDEPVWKSRMNFVALNFGVMF